MDEKIECVAFHYANGVIIRYRCVLLPQFASEHTRPESRCVSVRNNKKEKCSEGKEACGEQGGKNGDKKKILANGGRRKRLSAPSKDSN